jgi:hypothetical protein
MSIQLTPEVIMRRSLFGLAALAAGLLAVASLGHAQNYPSTNPTYIPSASLAAQSRTTAGVVATYQINNVDTLTFQITGTHATAVAHLEGTAQAQGTGVTETWTTIPVMSIGANQAGPSFTANGLYKANTSGLKQVRIVLDSIVSGTFTATMNGASAAFFGDYNQDLGALITFSNQAAGTVNSTPQFSYDAKGVSCRFVQTANTSTPSTVFSIQSYDAASATWLSLGSSVATTANNTPAALTVYPGVATPTTAVNAHLGAVWRVQAVVTGGAGSTGTLGCQKLK